MRKLLYGRLPSILIRACVFLTMATLPGLAQTYSIDWYSIDGGGGTSAGGVYAVSGTIGQPDAGAMRGGNYTLTGGFWGLFAVQTPGGPLLRITNSSGTVVVFWDRNTPGFVLDQTATLSGVPPPWAQVNSGYQTNSSQIFITVPAPSGNKFYRLRKP